MFLLKKSVRYFPRIFSTETKCYRNAPVLVPIISKRFIQLSPEKQENKTIVVPPLAESVTEGDVRVEKKVGDVVKTDEVIMEIETDKTSVPIPAPAPGVITELLVKDGDTVKPGQALFKMDIGATAPGKPVEKEPPPPSAPPPPTKQPEVGRVPLATGRPGEKREKMNRMRLKIAERLKEAQNTNAMLTTFNEIDMTELIKFRKEKQDEFQKKNNIKLGFMSPFIKSSAIALLDMPIVNAVIDRTDIIYRDYVDISVAVATPKGLVVPVLRNVEKMNFATIEKEIIRMADLAKNNVLPIEDMTGGTFTVSNGGVFGSLMGTPIINPPQSAILGMHATFDRPMAVKGKVEIRPMMYVAVTYDHRLIDGREAVLFLKHIKTLIEEPNSINGL